MLSTLRAEIRNRLRLRRHRRRDDRSSPAAVADRYDVDALLDEPATLGGHALPVTVEHAPERPRALADLRVDVAPRRYAPPDAVRTAIDPVLPALREYFELSAYHSESLLRVDSAAESGLDLSVTSYYRSFLTNLSADYALAGESLRDRLDRFVVADGRVTPLSRSPLSNHAGVGGLVVSTDGRSLLTTRSDAVSVARGVTSLSFAGSARYLPGADDPVRAGVLQELREEIGVREADVVAVHYLGTVRRLEWLGKPSVLTLVVVDDSTEFRNASAEHAAIHEFAFVASPSGVDDLLDAPAGARLLAAALDVAARGRTPGVELRACLSLLSAFRGSRRT